MRTTLIVTALLAATVACGCEENPVPRMAAQGAVDDARATEITRDVAIDVARRDAAARFGELGASFVNAQSLGRFWVVELRGRGGRGLHYAISKYDGSIRERSMVQ